MTNKYAVGILANDLDFVGYMLANIPKSLEDVQWFFVNETRIGDKRDDLIKIIEKSKIQQFELVDSKQIVEECKKHIIDTEFVDTYAMGMNILMVWWIFKFRDEVEKVLLCDEDVLFFNGVEKFFEYDEHAFVRYMFGTGAKVFNEQSKIVKRTMHEWFRIFGLKNVTQDWWQNVYLKRCLSSGNRMIVKSKFDIVTYEKRLKRFFKSDVLKERWDNRRVPTSYYLDERFETFFYLDTSNNLLSKDVCIFISKPEKVSDANLEKLCSGRFKLVHMANKSHKYKTYKILVKRGLINDRLT